MDKVTPVKGDASRRFSKSGQGTMYSNVCGPGWFLF